MSIISQEFADNLFTALRAIERSLPLLASAAVLIDPADEPIIIPAQRLLSKLFESLVALRDSTSLAELEANARKSTDQSWQEAIDIKSRITFAMAEIDRLTKLPV